MGLRDLLFGTPDPTQSWIANPTVSLELDLDRHMLGGVRLGEPVERISGLGPPDNLKATRDGCCEYKALGLQVGFDGGRIDSFQLVFAEAEYLSGYTPFAGPIRHHGQALALDSNTTLDDFMARFGEPYWRDDDDDETILFYEFAADFEWQVEVDEDSRLKALLLVTPPLMSGAEQRQVYGVNKPWPPSR